MNIEKLRKSNNLSIFELADLSGISATKLRYFEKGCPCLNELELEQLNVVLKFLSSELDNKSQEGEAHE